MMKKWKTIEQHYNELWQISQKLEQISKFPNRSHLIGSLILETQMRIKEIQNLPISSYWELYVRKSKITSALSVIQRVRRQSKKKIN